MTIHLAHDYRVFFWQLLVSESIPFFPTWFSWPFIIEYSETALKGSGIKASSFVRPF